MKVKEKERNRGSPALALLLLATSDTAVFHIILFCSLFGFMFSSLWQKSYFNSVDQLRIIRQIYPSKSLWSVPRPQPRPFVLVSQATVQETNVSSSMPSSAITCHILLSFPNAWPPEEEEMDTSSMPEESLYNFPLRTWRSLGTYPTIHFHRNEKEEAVNCGVQESYLAYCQMPSPVLSLCRCLWRALSKLYPTDHFLWEWPWASSTWWFLQLSPLVGAFLSSSECLIKCSTARISLWSFPFSFHSYIFDICFHSRLQHIFQYVCFFPELFFYSLLH